MPKKSAKSTVIAALADFIAWHKPRAIITLIGNDLKQADSRVGHYLRENIKLGDKKGYPDDGGVDQETRRRTKIKPSGYTIRYPNGSIVEMVPIDPRGEAGGNDDLIVASELWGWKYKSHEDMWTEKTISPNRFGYAQRWVDTYAGFEGESPILEPMYKSLVQPQNRLDPDFEMYALGAMFGTWVTKPLFPWQTPEYYASEEAQLAPEQFRRIHRNSWESSVEAFDKGDYWAACYDPDLPPVGRYEEIVVAMDAGTDDDNFGIVAVSRDRRKGAQDGACILRYARAWDPQNRDDWAVTDTEHFSFDGPKEELRRLCKNYNVVQVCFDPWQLKDTADQLEKEGVGWFAEFSQGGERTEADKMLYDSMRERKIAHNNNPALNAHIANANRKSTGEKMRIVKRTEDLKIDLAVCLSMAVARAREILP